MKFNLNARALNTVSLAVLAACVSQAAHAAEESVPLWLKLSETVSHDTNYARTTEKQPESISSTAVEVGLDKPYGRQYYFGNARFAIDKHDKFKNQNNQNYLVGLGASTEIASNWSASLNGNASENLNPAQENRVTERLDKNIRKHSDAGLKLRYGVSGRWSVVGSLGTARNSYSLVSYQNQDLKQVSAGLRMIYSPSDLLNFGVGTNYVDSDNPHQYVRGKPEGTKQRGVDLSSNWQVTGFSVLSAVVSFANNTYKSDSSASYRSVSGNLDWNFTPKGLTTYKLGIARSNDSDDASTSGRTGLFIGNGLPFNISYHNTTTAIDGSAKWSPTAKLSFTPALVWYQYDVERTQTLLGDDKSTSQYTAISLSSGYQYSRALGFGCTYQHYKQTGESNASVSYGNTRIAYTGNQYSCTASFKID